MEINVLENKKARLVFEGASATMCNLVKQELWNDDKVKMAGCNIAHPLTSKPRLTVETSGKDAKVAVADSITRVKKHITKLQKEVK